MALPMTRIQLGASDFSRSVAETPAISLVNRFYEQDPTSLEDQVALLSRPALRKWLTVGAGPIRGVYSAPGAFLGDLFVVSANTLYRISANETVTTIGTLGATTGNVSMAATDTTLFIADGSGLWYYTDSSYASGTLTASAVAVNDVVRIGSMYYKFVSSDVDTGTPTGSSGNPWLVLRGVTLAESLTNLSEAVNETGTAGTTYSTVLTGNTQVVVTSVTLTTLVVGSQLPGTDGNSIATTETGAGTAWGATTLAAGGATTFAAITTPDDVGIVSVGVIAGYCICVVSQGFNMDGRFYWIQPRAVIIDPLDFATAERSPDTVWDVVVVGDQFWLPGPSTNEVWTLSGDGDAPFIRIQGRLFDKGVWEGTVIKIKDDVMAVGTDGVVYRIDSQPNVVSNVGISQRIREAINAQRTGIATVLTPTVSIDFKNGVYSIGGVSKTLAQVCEQFATYGAYSSSDVVGGSGLLRTLSTAGLVSSTSSPALTSAASAAVLAAGVAAGFTAVMTFSVSLTGNGNAQAYVEMVAEDVSTGWGAQGLLVSPIGVGSIVYDYDVITAGSGVVMAGQHKLAFTLASDRLAGSMDGGSVQVSAAPQANTATRIMISALAVIAVASSGPVSSAVESVVFYETQIDADLVGLSA